MQLTYPGVYVSEVPSSVRPIATVSTSVGAFVDYFAEGIVDQAVQVFGMADFERAFGGIDRNSLASYQIAQFFLNGGPSAWVVRVAPGGTTAVYPSGSTPANAAIRGTNPGVWGNCVRVAIEPAVDPTNANAVSTDLVNIYVARYATSTASGPPVSSESYLAVSKTSSSSRYYVNVINASSQLAKFAGGAGATLPPLSGTVLSVTNPPGPVPPSVLWSTLNGKTFTVTYTTNGAPAAYTATFNYSTATNTVGALRAAIEAGIRTSLSASGLSSPNLAGATVTLIGNQLVVDASNRAAGYDFNATIKLTDTADNVLAETSLATVSVNAQEFALTGGAVGLAPPQLTSAADQATFTTALIGDQGAKTGMFALDRVDLFNLLSLPASVVLDGGGPPNMFTAIVSQAITYCEQRRAMMLVDIPATVTTPAEMQDWCNANATTINSANAAVYFPRVAVPDPKNEYRSTSVPNSGTLAGIYARTDTNRGVWKAPAGIDTTLSGVSGLDYAMTDGENGVLNPAGINCLRSFPVYGLVAWGTRTTLGADAQASQWKYIPVRRLALMIEESLFRGTKWCVFEPNDEPLWAKIRQNVGAFMTNLFRQGAFAGSTPDQAYFVKCDGTTTTPIDQNNGVVNIQVGFAPLQPAEFVVLQIQQIPDLT